MALALENLDESTREHMLAELDRDERTYERPYTSPRLSPAGAEAYPRLLRDAITGGDDNTLEASLSEPGLFNATEAYGPEKAKTRKMNVRAPQILAEGEFNRYFIRGLCALLCANGGGEVEVFRARKSSWARPESEALIGRRIDATELLEDLRAHVGESPSLLPDVNSGLSVRLPR